MPVNPLLWPVVAVRRLVGGQRWTRWEVIAEEFMPVRIKHRDKNSTSAQQLEMSLVAIDSALLSKMSNMARTAVF